MQHKRMLTHMHWCNMLYCCTWYAVLKSTSHHTAISPVACHHDKNRRETVREEVMASNEVEQKRFVEREKGEFSQSWG